MTKKPLKPPKPQSQYGCVITYGTRVWNSPYTADEMCLFILKNKKEEVGELMKALGMPWDVFQWFYRDYVVPYARKQGIKL